MHTHRFCIIAGARSGSEYFTTRLNEHPEIACHRELFNRHKFVTGLDEASVARLPTLEWRDANSVASIDEVEKVSSEAFPGKWLFGFKLFLSHAEDVRKHVRQDMRYKLIVLERRNKLAQYASFLTARKTGRWSVWADDDMKFGRETVTVDLPGLDRYVRLEEQRYGKFRERLGKRADVLQVSSEELDARFVEILDFLGVDVAPQLRIVRLRQNPDPLSERVENWSEVLGWLGASARSEWAREQA